MKNENFNNQVEDCIIAYDRLAPILSDEEWKASLIDKLYSSSSVKTSFVKLSLLRLSMIFMVLANVGFVVFAFNESTSFVSTGEIQSRKMELKSISDDLSIY